MLSFIGFGLKTREREKKKIYSILNFFYIIMTIFSFWLFYSYFIDYDFFMNYIDILLIYINVDLLKAQRKFNEFTLFSVLLLFSVRFFVNNLCILYEIMTINQSIN